MFRLLVENIGNFITKHKWDKCSYQQFPLDGTTDCHFMRFDYWRAAGIHDF